MLSSILKSRRAVLVNIAIMRAFVKLRYALNTEKDLSRQVERLSGKVNLIETDVRLLTCDVRKIQEGPTPKNPRVRGFTKD